MCKRMAVIAGIALCLATCNGANGEVIDFFASSAPSGPSMPGVPSLTDTLGILDSAGSRVYDDDGDGWIDASPSKKCNPMGYVVFHPFNQRMNVYLRFHDWGPGQAPFWISGGGSGGGMGIGLGGGMWPWPWDFDGFDYEFGSSEDPNPGNLGDFGVGEGGTVPEPCSLTLLILGAVGVLLRRPTANGLYWTPQGSPLRCDLNQ